MPWLAVALGVLAIVAGVVVCVRRSPWCVLRRLGGRQAALSAGYLGGHPKLAAKAFPLPSIIYVARSGILISVGRRRISLSFDDVVGAQEEPWAQLAERMPAVAGALHAPGAGGEVECFGIRFRERAEELRSMFFSTARPSDMAAAVAGRIMAAREEYLSRRGESLPEASGKGIQPRP